MPDSNNKSRCIDKISVRHQQKRKKHSIFRSEYILIFLLTLVISACNSNSTIAVSEIPTSTTANTSVPTPTAKPRVDCPDDRVEKYIEDLGLTLEEWEDTSTVAGSTARMSLSPIISQLQEIRRNTRRIDRPECGNFLNEIVIVAMDRGIEAYIAFLSQESDSVVSRKFSRGKKAWGTAYTEFEAFKENALQAYEKSTISAEDLEILLNQVEPFTLPDEWENVNIPESEYLVSIPDSWRYNTYGDTNEYIVIANEEGSTRIGVYPEEGLTDIDPSLLLSVLQYSLDSENFDFYLEKSAEYGVYAENQGYVVIYSARVTTDDEIEDNIRAYIVTPQKDIFLIEGYTSDDEFNRFDLATIEQLFGSIRLAETGASNPSENQTSTINPTAITATAIPPTAIPTTAIPTTAVAPTSTERPTSTPLPTVTPTSTIPSSLSAVDYSFQGNGTSTTDIFSLPGGAIKITWEYGDENFIWITLKQIGNEDDIEIAFVEGPTKGQKIVEVPAGENYYLDVNTASGNWTITISGEDVVKLAVTPAAQQPIYTFQGNGASTTDVFGLPGGAIKITWEYGDENFIWITLKQIGNEDDIEIAFVEGPTKGQKIVEVPAGEYYYLDVNAAGGNWTITIEIIK